MQVCLVLLFKMVVRFRSNHCDIEPLISYSAHVFAAYFGTCKYSFVRLPLNGNFNEQNQQLACVLNSRCKIAQFARIF